jgi:1,4-dihydroxy-2-naphthoate octaprenyltransferase
VLGVKLGHLPRTCLIGLIALVLAVPTFVGARRHADDVTRLIPFLSLNVMIAIATPVLVAIGLFLG